MTLDVDALRSREYPWAARGDAIYLNAASTGPLPRRAVAALTEWAELRGEMHRLGDELQFNTLRRGRELAAALIGASPSEIALATNTSFGVNLAAWSLPLERGDVIVTPDREFPANVYPWMAAARARGLEYRILPVDESGIVDEHALLAALDDRAVRCLSVSWVSFVSGQRLDLQRLGRACEERGIWFVVDAIQGLGAYTLDVNAANIDILACGGQKWLLSPWGSGFVYVRSTLLRELEPHDVSWMSPRGTDDFRRLLDYDMTWRDDARRFEFVTLPFQDFAGMNASLEMLCELGADEVAAHVTSLADSIVDWATRNSVALITPSDSSQRAGVVSLKPKDAASVSNRLRKANVVHSYREGAIRLAPHVYNTHEEIAEALSLISG